MNLKKEISTGIQMSTATFSFVWAHPRLLAFLGIPAFISILAATLIHNVSTFDHQKTILIGLAELMHLFASGPYWFTWLISQLLVYLSLTIEVICTMLLITYATHHLKKSSIDKAHISSLFRTKGLLILTWALIQLIEIKFLQYLAISEPSRGLTALGMGASMLWHLMSAFVIVFITLEHATISRAIASSLALIQCRPIMILAGLLWLSFLAFLASLPVNLPMILVGSQPYSPSIVMLCVASLILIRYTLATTITLFKTLVYQDTLNK